MEKFKFIVSGLWAFLSPFIKILLTTGGTILIQSCMAAVTAVATNMQDSSGEEKRAQALRIIQADLTNKGIAMTASVINAALEAAVVKMKNELR
jgi:hypothetical protein